MLLTMEKGSPQSALQMSHITPAFAPHFTDAQVKRDGRTGGRTRTRTLPSLVACRIAKMAEEERARDGHARSSSL